jgi:glycosyltransferase involved in cell wall biosynthesis
MRILYHHRTRSTDAQRIHILEIIRAFQALGHSVDIACLVDPEKGKEDASRDAGVPLWKRITRHVPWGTEVIQLGYNVVGIPLLAAKLIRNRPDFIYERYALFNFAGALLARIFRIPIVLEVNSPCAFEHKREGDIRGYRFAAWTERVICNASAKVIVVSTPLRRILIDLGVKADKIVVMPNGINPEHFRSDPAAAAAIRQRYGLEGKTVIGFVGWFRPWHSLDLLIQAFHRASAFHEDARLMLIGDGPETEYLQDYARTHGIAEKVVLTGPIPHDEVPPYLDVIDIAVQPAANEYCCPMKILEYMGLGKAIVGPRQENIEELVQDGDSACLFTPGSLESMTEAMLRVLRDQGSVSRMGRRCLAIVRERELFWSGNARKVIELLGTEEGSPAPLAATAKSRR